MKKVSDMTKEQLIKTIQEKSPEFILDQYILKHIDGEFEQLSRSNLTTMEVFENETSEGVNEIYDFVVRKDGIPPNLPNLRKMLYSETAKATPLFVTPNKFHVGIPLLIFVNSKAKKA